MPGRDRMRLWRDPSLPAGLDLLRASCFDHSYPLHSHDEFVVAVFSRGAQRHRVARHRGVASAGMLLVIPPGEVHAGEAAEPDRGWDYCAFYPPPGFLADLADDRLGGAGGLDFGAQLLRHDAAMSRVLLRAHAVLERSRDPLEKHCALAGALGALVARYGERTRGGAPPSSRAPIGDAIAFLEAHHHRPVRVGEVAAAAGLSEFHLMRVFRAATGLSVHHYLTQIRLRRAKDLLARGVGAAETAVAAGFFDQSHLINRFRAAFGVTPGRFAADSLSYSTPSGARMQAGPPASST
ncbi:helix-turn-helix transcriptional regulator [Methylobacterium oryzihabitans]|uniref:AraC family transcriptional regulator n=1 Tax=Methylobacterium oryzihabitans TaxID=2499852 RepID=A0A437P572_9HYPH|nr:AraC family transcriptional regulator [Methylobacterium oryzihabitans]RVU17402.1 AraC family transcriptional regulator [Methylobacterium oryzihabitans]